MDRRLSVAVIGGPSRVGKSTLLWALLEFLPAPTRRIFIRGNYETFDFMDEPATVPELSVLLVNEISPFLPVYAWGTAVREILAAKSAGYQVAATAHAGSAAAFVALLRCGTIRAPLDQAPGFDLVTLVEPEEGDPEGLERRRVTKIWHLTKAKPEMHVQLLYGGGESDISLEINYPTPSQTSPFTSIQIKNRSDWLRRMRAGEATGLPSVLLEEGY